MEIAVLGTGHVGTALARKWAAAGHQVRFGSRAGGGEPASTESDIPRLPATEAVAGAEVVLLAIPWPAAQTTLEPLRDALDGTVLIDCTNPLNVQFSGLDLGFDTSAAESIAAWVPEARVVKAFNTVSAAAMADPQFGDQKAAMFYCGDDDEARATVRQLAEEVGFDPVDAGPLLNARYLEPFAMLYIYLAMNGWGGNCAFQILRR